MWIIDDKFFFDQKKYTGHFDLFRAASCPTLPFWDHRGGSSCPRGKRPVSKQERKARRWPPGGKWSGGRWIPSWLTRTSVPPQSAGMARREHLESIKQRQWLSVFYVFAQFYLNEIAVFCWVQTSFIVSILLTSLVTVNTDDLSQGNSQCIVPVNAVNRGYDFKLTLCKVLIIKKKRNTYLFSRSQSPSVPLISWFGVHLRVRFSPAWCRDK